METKTTDYLLKGKVYYRY